MTRKRFGKLILAMRFQRNDLPAAQRAALREYGSYGNAIQAIRLPLASGLTVIRVKMPRELRRKE